MTTTVPETVDPERIRVGVSACLLGEAVRYDGGHKHNRTVTEVLARHFELVPCCPEVAIGLGVPRPPIELRGDPESPRVVGVDDPALDVTGALDACGREVAAGGGLSGYLLKKGSPSCGLRDVPVFGDDGDAPPASGTGRYAAAIRRLRPLLPMEEEDRIDNPAMRDHFVLRVIVHHRWQCLLADGITPARLVAFHTEHKYLMLAHDPRRYRALGPLVARAGRDDPTAAAHAYGAELMAALAQPAGRNAHCNALQHAAGHLRGRLTEH